MTMQFIIQFIYLNKPVYNNDNSVTKNAIQINSKKVNFNEKGYTKDLHVD